MPKRIRKKNKLKNENTGDLDLADQITVDKLNKLREMKSKQTHMIKTVKQQMIFIEERKVY